MDIFTGKNQFIDEEKKIETANFAARRKENSDGKHSNGKVVNHREMIGLTRHWPETYMQKVLWVRFEKSFGYKVFSEPKPKTILIREESKEERNYCS